MEFLEKLFGDPTELVKRVLTHTSAALVKPLLVQFLNSRMYLRAGRSWTSSSRSPGTRCTTAR